MADEKPKKNKYGPRGAVLGALKKTLGLLCFVIPVFVLIYLLNYVTLPTGLEDRITELGGSLAVKMTLIFIPAIALAAVFGYFPKGDKRRLAACIAANIYAIMLMVMCAITIGGAIEGIPLDFAGIDGTIDITVDFLIIIGILCICPVIAMAIGYLEYKKANIKED